jgi:hypothetical protein
MDNEKCFKDYLQELVSLMETNNFLLQQLFLLQVEQAAVINLMEDPEIDPCMNLTSPSE